jgi:hypothetical protein
MLLQENVKIDFIVEFYDQGLHSILERIVLRLPPRTILSCKEVNNNWRQIILFYHQAENTRIAKIQDQRISEEWKKKTPIIYKLSLEKFQINQVSCFQIIGDKIQIIIAANINQTKFAKIIVVNADSFEVDCILDLKNENGGDLEVLEVKMAMDKNFLTAFVSDGGGQQFYQVWNRSDNYSENPQRRPWHPEPLPRVHAHLANIPILRDGCLHIYEREMYNREPVFVYQVWDLAQNTVRQETAKTPHHTLTAGRETYRMKNVTITDHFDRQNLMKKIKTIRSENSVLWTINSKRFLDFYDLIGFNDDYLVIKQGNRVNNAEVVVYHAQSGNKILSFFCRDNLHFMSKSECQISNNLVAFKGAICAKNFRNRSDVKCEKDLFILNLKTGAKILTCDEEMGFPVDKFLLQKGKMILETDGKIISAQFWP